jgi:hypothetical protein
MAKQAMKWECNIARQPIKYGLGGNEMGMKYAQAANEIRLGSQ